MADIYPVVEGEVAVIVNQTETDPTVPDCVKAITEDDITNWNKITELEATITELEEKVTALTAE